MRPRRVDDIIELEKGSGEDFAAKIVVTVENDEDISSYSAYLETNTPHLDHDRSMEKHLDTSESDHGAEWGHKRGGMSFTSQICSKMQLMCKKLVWNGVA